METSVISRYLNIKTKKGLKKFNDIVRNNVFYSVLILVNILLSILMLVLQGLPMWLCIQLIIFSTIVYASIKFSKWYILLSILPLFELFRNLWIFVDLSSYTIQEAMGYLDFLYPLASWTTLSAILLVILYGVYLFIRKAKNRFSHLIIIATNFIWVVVCWLYMNSYSVHQWYSSFTSPERWYVIVKDDYYWVFFLSYMLIIDTMLVLYEVTKNRYNMDKQ